MNPTLSAAGFVRPEAQHPLPCGDLAVWLSRSSHLELWG